MSARAASQIADVHPNHAVPIRRRDVLVAGLCLCCAPKRIGAAETFAMEEVGPGKEPILPEKL